MRKNYVYQVNSFKNFLEIKLNFYYLERELALLLKDNNSATPDDQTYVQ